MSENLQTLGARFPTAEERARLREIAVHVARAAKILLKQRRTSLSKSDLEAAGTLGVWRRLATFDPSRGTFDRWAFYRAFQAMLDASGEARDETKLAGALRQGTRGYVVQDDRPAETSDFYNDTPETDLARARRRLAKIRGAGWLQPMLEAPSEGAPVERTIAATDVLRAVHEEVARLSDEQRTYLHLRFWDDTEVLDVGARMGISERTLRRRWAETRDVLEVRLRARGIFGIPEGFGEVADMHATGGLRPGAERHTLGGTPRR